MAGTKLTDVFLRGTHAARPAAAAANTGYYYFETDTGTLFQSDGAAWNQIAISDQTSNLTFLDATVAAAPATPATGKLRLYAKTGKVLAVKDDAGVETVLGAGGGGGGLAQSYVGYNTVGASQETPSNAKKQYFKQITLAATAHFRSVAARLIQIADANYSLITAGIYDDVSGVPGHLLAAGEFGSGGICLEVFPGPTWTARWLEVPVAVDLAAGTYWLMFGPGGENIYYDTSGTDRTQVPGAGATIGDYLNTAAWSPATTTNKYSIRASILS